MKLQLLSELGIPFDLSGVDEIKVLLPYHIGNLEKITKIPSDDNYVEVEISDFEIQGLKEGPAQTFYATVKKGNSIYTFEFPKMLTVASKDGRKVIE